MNEDKDMSFITCTHTCTAAQTQVCVKGNKGRAVPTIAVSQVASHMITRSNARMLKRGNLTRMQNNYILHPYWQRARKESCDFNM